MNHIDRLHLDLCCSLIQFSTFLVSFKWEESPKNMLQKIRSIGRNCVTFYKVADANRMDSD